MLTLILLIPEKRRDQSGSKLVLDQLFGACSNEYTRTTHHFSKERTALEKIRKNKVFKCSQVFSFFRCDSLLLEGR